MSVCGWPDTAAILLPSPMAPPTSPQWRQVNPLGPAQTTDILPAGLVVTEAFVHRLKRARVIKSSDRVSSGVHQTGVPRPSGAVKGIPIFHEYRRSVRADGWRSYCRRVCGDTRLAIPAAFAVACTARQSCRAVIGLTGLWPGKSQPCGRAAHRSEEHTSEL